MGLFGLLAQKISQAQRRTPSFGFRFSRASGTSPSEAIVVLPPTDLARARATFREFYVKTSPNPEAAASAISACSGNSNLEAFNDEMMFSSDKAQYLNERFGPNGVKWGSAGKEGLDPTGVHRQTIAFPDGRSLTLFFDLSRLAFPKGYQPIFF
jgi:hypothetical protein